MMPTIETRRLRIARALAAIAALVLAGCGIEPVRKPGVQVPAAWSHLPAASAELGPAPDLRGWWRAFGDEDLDRLVDRALAGNLDLRQAELRLEAARALEPRAAADFRPNLGAHTFSEPTPDSSASYFQMGFDSKWELGLFGRAEATDSIARADVGLAASDVASARVSVVAEVVRTFVALRSAERRVELLTGVVEAARQHAGLIATRVRLHLATAASASEADAAIASAEAALAEPELAVDTNRQRLAVLLGATTLPADAIGSGAPLDLGPLAVAEAPADLLRTRPEIRHAEQSILKAAGELGIAHADLFPRLAIGGSLTYSARVIGHTRLADADGIVTFGPLIDIPIFDWGARRAVESARDAELRAAIVAYRAAVLDGVAEAENAMAALERARERTAALGRAVAAAERSDASTATLGRLGLADDIDRGEAKTALLKSRLALLDAEDARNVAFIAFYKALGGAPLPESAIAERAAP